MIYRSRDPEVPVLGAFLRECLEAGREDEDARRVVRIRDLFGAYLARCVRRGLISVDYPTLTAAVART